MSTIGEMIGMLKEGDKSKKKSSRSLRRAFEINPIRATVITPEGIVPEHARVGRGMTHYHALEDIGRKLGLDEAQTFDLLFGTSSNKSLADIAEMGFTYGREGEFLDRYQMAKRLGYDIKPREVAEFGGITSESLESRRRGDPRSEAEKIAETRRGSKKLSQESAARAQRALAKLRKDRALLEAGETVDPDRILKIRKITRAMGKLRNLMELRGLRGIIPRLPSLAPAGIIAEGELQKQPRGYTKLRLMEELVGQPGALGSQQYPGRLEEI